MSAIVVIPARFASTRFPGKPLALLRGKPVIQHVHDNASGSQLADAVIVATDHEGIYNTVLSFGGKAVMTSGSHLSGTDRIAEVACTLNYDIIVNVQGDEPLIAASMIDDVISVLEDGRASIGTLAIKIRDAREICDPNVVKAIFTDGGFALYFSRSPVPFHRDEWELRNAEFRFPKSEFESQQFHCYKHIGIYSYRREVLVRLSKTPPSRLELIEKLEQLRALENGFAIKVRETSTETFGVDTPGDLERIEKWLNSSS